tara:strand:- start:3560 stop:3952 length:393 start_codon:yes stop_codon:yes gene_type:complete
MHFFEKLFIHSLVFFFSLLVALSFFSFFTSKKEGLENNKEKEKESTGYKDYDTDSSDNALILAQKNAGNIMVLRQKIDEQDGMGLRLDNLEATVENQQSQLDALVQQQAQYAQDISASEPVSITGTDETE